MKEYLVRMQPRGCHEVVTITIEAPDILAAMVKARETAGLEDIKLQQFSVTPLKSVNPETDNSDNN